MGIRMVIKQKQKKLKSRVAAMILSISLTVILLLGFVCGSSIVRMKQNTVSSMERLNQLALQDSTAALRQQKMAELQALAANKSSLADTSLTLILNQTRLVALAGEDLFAQGKDCLIREENLEDWQLQVYDFSCAAPEQIGKYSIHIRAPKEMMEKESVQEKNGVVTQARLDLRALIKEEAETQEERYQALREYYVAAGLREVLGGIRNFDNRDGTYRGIGATYFCLESSGIDILADTLTTEQIEYDARNSTWYQEAKKLGPGEVYWSDPVLDGSGRGTALICAMPVYVEGKLIGVAGSGGLIDNIRELVQSTTIGESGYAFLVNQQQDGTMKLITNANTEQQSEIARHRENLLETENQELLGILQRIANQESGIAQIALDGEEVFLAYAPLKVTPWTMVTVLGIEDGSISRPIQNLERRIKNIAQKAIRDSNTRILWTVFFFLLSITAVILLAAALAYRFSERLTRPILQLTEGAKIISGGDLKRKIDIATGDEIQVLGEAFNHMTDSLVEYIRNLSEVTAEKERIGAELHVATQIQASMLPCIFPAFPEKKQFDIFALMQPAKEVGGDFYDFFLTDETHLAVVMADVSGKGVPAALFMVIAKTLIKNYAQMGHMPAQVFAAVNEQLCENNEAGMFVTGWMGILAINTGDFVYANAGHNPPLLRHSTGTFTYLKSSPGFVLAGMEGITYEQKRMTLKVGDILYLYTDGVTEAVNQEAELYGESRLQAVLDAYAQQPLDKLLLAVKQDIAKFAKKEPQFDDITMLALKRNQEAEEEGELEIDSGPRNLYDVKGM